MSNTEPFTNVDPFESDRNDVADRTISGDTGGAIGTEREGRAVDGLAEPSEHVVQEAKPSTNKDVLTEDDPRSHERANPLQDNAQKVADEATLTDHENSKSNEGIREPFEPALVKKETETHNETPTVLETLKTATHVAKDKLHVHSIRAQRPANFFHPTSIRMHVRWHDDDEAEPSDATNVEEPSGRELHLIWQSRDNRKGRGSVAVPLPGTHKPHKPILPRMKEVLLNIVRMFSMFPYWDMAFWSGFCYAIGSVLFVLDGAFAWSVVAFPDTEFPGEEKYVTGILFFIGALFYQVGASVAYLECINDGSFQGSAMKRLLDGHAADAKDLLDENLHAFFGHLLPFHTSKKQSDEAAAEKAANEVDPEAGWRTKNVRNQRPGSIYPQGKHPARRRGGIDLGETEEGESSEYLVWRWWPTWHALRTRHIYEIGYVACAIQLVGATLYGLAGVVALPGILSSLEPWQENFAYWYPEIVASACFLTASVFFTLETQDKWYIPQPQHVSWWIGAWAFIGSMGFMLNAALGPASYKNTGAEYQSELASMWGSAAYLASSLCQWYEAVNKYPTQAFPIPKKRQDIAVPAAR